MRHDDDGTVWVGNECVADPYGDEIAALVAAGHGAAWERWMAGRRVMPSLAELKAFHERLKAGRAKA